MDIGAVTGLPNPTKIEEGIELNRNIRVDSRGNTENSGRASYWLTYKYSFEVVGTVVRDALLSTYDQIMPVNLTLNGESYDAVVLKTDVTTIHDNPGYYKINLDIESDRQVIV
jgi:hypothetical protein